MEYKLLYVLTSRRRNGTTLTRHTALFVVRDISNAMNKNLFAALAPEGRGTARTRPRKRYETLWKPRGEHLVDCNNVSTKRRKGVPHESTFIRNDLKERSADIRVGAKTKISRGELPDTAPAG